MEDVGGDGGVGEASRLEGGCREEEAEEESDALGCGRGEEVIFPVVRGCGCCNDICGPLAWTTLSMARGPA